MEEIESLFENNRCWVKDKTCSDPGFFTLLTKQHKPKYLWIGCSDSRVPVNEILGLQAGDVFVHRNIANIFPHTDFNCLSVLQYGVEYLEIKDVIVCGHYMCGGVSAAMKNKQFGLIDNWLQHIRDVYAKEQDTLNQIYDEQLKYNRLVEFNVIHQVRNICHTTIVQNAWAKNRQLCIHGWVYDIATGLLKDLKCSVSALDQLEDVYLNFH